MPRPRLQPRRHRGPRPLIESSPLSFALAIAATAVGCADAREPVTGCADCGIHPAGILDPASPDFHGAELARRDWDFPLCASCHGADFGGGSSGVSCLDCHDDGPTACGTCHDERPETGAHAAHRGVGPSATAGSPAWTDFRERDRRAPEGSPAGSCGECHLVPGRWDDEGHILRGGRADPAPAEVVFGAAAGQTPAFAVRRAPPSYDPASGRCSDVYCHGDALGDAGAALTRPTWRAVGTGQAACGTCHGDPPASHADDRCAACHPASAPHIDGVLAIGVRPGCAGCHGSESNPAPPGDLAGDQLTTAVGVGAHQSHLRAGARLRGPLGCADCHAVPAAVGDPGHIDSPAPAEVALAGGGAWRREDATCETWCHGASRPVWTRVGQGEVSCGSCHGIPPAGAPHDPDLELTDCAGCHPATVDAFGNILRAGPPGAETSHHMDGHVDL